MLEKQSLPRYKPCGGGLSLKFLENQFPFSFEPVIDRRVNEISYSFWGMNVSQPCKSGVMGMVMRDRFDAHILAHARCDLRQGSSVRAVHETDEYVEVETADGKSERARFLIGADGANSVAASTLGLRQRRKSLPAIEVEVPVPERVMQRYPGPVFIFEGPRYGYTWIFPKANCLSVGIAGFNPKRGELQSTFARVMKAEGIPLDGAVQHGHTIPLYDARLPVATRRILLAGDAAGMADPFSGEGIRPAIKSGRLAAESILSSGAETYSALIRKEIGWRNRDSQLLVRIFYPLRELCMLVGGPNPFTTAAILDLLSDRGSSLRVFFNALLTLPYFVPMEVLAEAVGKISGRERAARFRSAVFPGY